jgi:Ca2+-binding RTX toxin-like protein
MSGISGSVNISSGWSVGFDISYDFGSDLAAFADSSAASNSSSDSDALISGSVDITSPWFVGVTGGSIIVEDITTGFGDWSAASTGSSGSGALDRTAEVSSDLNAVSAALVADDTFPTTQPPGTNNTFSYDGTQNIGGTTTNYNDWIKTGAGNDQITSVDITNTGVDWISTGGGNDTVAAGAGADHIWGDGGNDELNGEAGNDKIFGGDGADFIFGGQGNDTLSGGTGSDQFVYQNFTDGMPGIFTALSWGTDTINNFEDGADKIVMTAVWVLGNGALVRPVNIDDFTITQSGADTQIVYDHDTSCKIILHDFNAALIDQSDFSFLV